MIRVTRFLEYQYPDAKSMHRDMERWTPNIRTSTVKMRSALLIPEWVDENDTTTTSLNDQQENEQ